jgi:hypothetical protein
MRAAGADVQPTAPGGWLDVGDGVALWVEDAGAGGLAVHVVYGNFDARYEGGTLDAGAGAAGAIHAVTDGVSLGVLD